MMPAYNLLSELDYERLSRVIDNLSKNGQIQHQLEKKIDEMEIVDPVNIPNDLITMNTELTCKSNDSSGDNSIPHRLKLVYPTEADFEHGKISILSPLGTALLGAKTGTLVSWNGPDGKTRDLRLKNLVYQPEANNIVDPYKWTTT